MRTFLRRPRPTWRRGTRPLDHSTTTPAAFQSPSTTTTSYGLPAPALFIDNEFVAAEGGATLPVHSPRDGAAFASIANGSVADVDRAVSWNGVPLCELVSCEPAESADS